MESNIKEKLEIFSSVASLMMKISLFIGGSAYLAYSYSNQFLPRGITLGDSLLFIFVALCFGLIYALSVFSLTNLGVAISPLLKAIFHAANFVLRKTNKKELPLTRLYKFNWSSLFFGAYGALIVILLWVKSWDLGVSALALSIALYFLLSSIVYWRSELDRLNREISSTLEIKNCDHSLLARDIKNNRTKVFLSIGFLALAPLIMSNISSTLVEGAMRRAGIRIDNAVAYLKSPYDQLISDSLAAKECPAIAEYSCFRLTISFTGAGSTTLVQGSNPISGKMISIEIPNEEIIIVRDR